MRAFCNYQSSNDWEIWLLRICENMGSCTVLENINWQTLSGKQVGNMCPRFFFSFFCSLWDLTSPTTDETLAFGSESRESWSLDHQEFPSVPDLKTYTFSSSMPFSKSILLTYVYKGLTTAMFTTVLAKDWKWPKRPSTGVLFIIQYTPANVWSLGWKDPLE